MSMWGGRFSEGPDELVTRMGESVSYDQQLYAQDIRASMAHARMLGHQGIIPSEDAAAIIAELERIRDEIARGDFHFDTSLEDIHMNIEARLTERLGDAGARLHSGRSRNDQIATDVRLYCRDAVDALDERVAELQRALVEVGEANADAIFPGLTHLQYGQPVLFAHHLLAYVEMLARDRERLADCRRRVNRSPLGAGALAGSTLPLDREATADELGFAEVLRNSMDAVSDRDFAVELVADLAILAMHLSRLSEDLILWVSQTTGYVELGDGFCTGSSLMPQKKNPDMAELTRGKTARVYGDLTALLTLLKGLPLCYNRDLQEDKEPLFDAVHTLDLVLATYAPMLRTLRVNREAMQRAASDPALMATDLAEWLVRQGIPFRAAHHRVGRFVAWCREHGVALNEASLEQMRETVPEATEACPRLFDPAASVAARDLLGGTAPAQVRRQLDFWQQRLG